MKKLLREPLLHFLLLGAAIFAVYTWMPKGSRGGGGDAGALVVTQGQIAALAAGFNLIW